MSSHLRPNRTRTREQPRRKPPPPPGQRVVTTRHGIELAQGAICIPGHCIGSLPVHPHSCVGSPGHFSHQRRIGNHAHGLLEQLHGRGPMQLKGLELALATTVCASGSSSILAILSIAFVTVQGSQLPDAPGRVCLAWALRSLLHELVELRVHANHRPAAAVRQGNSGPGCFPTEASKPPGCSSSAESWASSSAAASADRMLAPPLSLHTARHQPPASSLDSASSAVESAPRHALALEKGARRKAQPSTQHLRRTVTCFRGA